MCYFHMQLTWLDWSRSRSRSRSFWSRSHNRFLVSVSVSISVSHFLVSVLVLVSLCSGLVIKPGMTQPTVSKHWRKIRLQSHQVHHTTLTTIQQLCSIKQKHTKYTEINANKSTHSEIGPVWRNPIQRTVRTAHLCVFMTVHSYSTQYNTVQFW